MLTAELIFCFASVGVLCCFIGMQCSLLSEKFEKNAKFSGIFY